PYKGPHDERLVMYRINSLTHWVVALLLPLGAASCSTSDAPAPATDTRAAQGSRWSHQDWPTGHYRVADNWPKPLPDTRHSHDGWTWGSFGGVYAETSDRIWIAMRG